MKIIKAKNTWDNCDYVWVIDKNGKGSFKMWNDKHEPTSISDEDYPAEVKKAEEFISTIPSPEHWKIITE